MMKKNAILVVWYIITNPKNLWNPLNAHANYYRCVVVVSCEDVHTESGSAGVDTVQVQGWKENRRLLS